MTKAAILKKMSEDAKLTPEQAKAALEAFLKIASKSLAEGDRVNLINFGTFVVATRSERKGKHPVSGKRITIAERKVVKFRPGMELMKKLK